MVARSSLPAFAVGLLPAVAFTLHDLVFQLPDNQHEASLGFFVALFALLLVWGSTGYLAARGSATVMARIGTGAIAAVASVAGLWLTFITLNMLFSDRMSYEPDRIRTFQASGDSTMREYMQYRRGAGPFPLVMGVAALVGVIGGAIGATPQVGQSGR
jgi:hypothetical protein